MRGVDHKKRTDWLISNVLPKFMAEGGIGYVPIFVAFRKYWPISRRLSSEKR